jgi:hypothetical protein
MATENSRVLYTERTTGAAVVTTELNALANDTAAVGAALSNDASTERNLLADFMIVIPEQGGARDGGAISLLIVPEVNSTYGDVASVKTALIHVAHRDDGTLCSFVLDSAVTARTITIQNVKLPNANFKVGLLNESGYALAATGSSIWMSGRYQPASITV